jgi:hypothetical protein
VVGRRLSQVFPNADEMGVALALRRGVIVKDTGSITTKGMATSPVTFKGKNEIATGYWNGISIESNNANNKLTHTNIAHAGAQKWTGDTESDAALFVKDSSLIALDTVSFGPGGGYAVHLSAPSSALTCKTVTFTGLVKGPIWKDDPAPGAVLSGCP